MDAPASTIPVASAQSASEPQPVPRVDNILDLAAVSLTTRIADFWTDQPRLWFVQLEAILAAQKLGDEQNYNIVITKLNKEVVRQVSDILSTPPPSYKYEALKQRLLEVYEETENRQLQKLLTEMELGDQKPSQLLRRMRELAKGRMNDDTVKIMWTSHLPQAVRAVIAVTEVKDLQKLAAVADKILETTRPIEISEVSSSPSSSGNTCNRELVAAISKLTAKVDQLQTRSRSPWRGRNSRSPSTSRGRSSSRSRRTPDSPDWLCFYHFRYKNKAHRCVSPCHWKKEDKAEN